MSKSPQSEPNSPENTRLQPLTDAESRLLDLAWKETFCALSAGFTHDLCNLMTGMVSLSETLLVTRDATDPARKPLTLIRDTALKAGQLAQRIQRLHRDIPGQKSFLDLNQEISSLAGLLQKLLLRRVAVQTALETGQLPIEVEIVELRQVILDLAAEFARAMPNGGSLLFRTSRLDSPPAKVTFKSSTIDSQNSKSWVQLTLQAVIEGAAGTAQEPVVNVDPSSLRASFLSGDPKQQSGLALWRAMLFVERHSAAFSLTTSESAAPAVVQICIPLADVSK